MRVPLPALVLWQNDGSAAMATGIVSGSVRYLPPTSVSIVPVADSVNNWHPIDLQGADYLRIALMTKIIDKGGITAIAGPNSSVVAIGAPYLDDDFQSPITAGITPAAITSTEVLFAGSKLFAMSNDINTNNAIELAVSDYAHANHGLFAANASPANGDVISTFYDLAIRPSSSSAKTVGQATWPLRVSGLRKVWLAVAVFHTLTGTVATTKLLSKLVALRYYESPSSRM